MSNESVETLNPPLKLTETQQFLYREARLLDEEKFEEWRGLFGDDPLYWMVDRDQEDVEEDDWVNHVSQVHRDGKSLDYFIDRATSEQAWVYQRARVDRFYTNVMVDDPEKGQVFCKWIMQLVRKDRNTADWFGGKSYYRFTRREDDLRISMKKVVNTKDLVPRGYQPIV